MKVNALPPTYDGRTSGDVRSSAAGHDDGSFKTIIDEVGPARAEGEKASDTAAIDDDASRSPESRDHQVQVPLNPSLTANLLGPLTPIMASTPSSGANASVMADNQILPHVLLEPTNVLSDMQKSVARMTEWLQSGERVGNGQTRSQLGSLLLQEKGFSSDQESLGVADLGVVTDGRNGLNRSAQPEIVQQKLSTFHRPIENLQAQMTDQAWQVKNRLSTRVDIKDSAPSTHRQGLTGTIEESMRALTDGAEGSVETFTAPTGGGDVKTGSTSSIKGDVSGMTSSSETLVDSTIAPSLPGQIAGAVRAELTEATAASVTDGQFGALSGEQSQKGIVLRQLDLVLQPAELGRVVVKLRLMGSSLSISVGAENNGTRELIDKELGRLRDELADAGYDIDRVQVFDAAGPTNIKDVPQDTSIEQQPPGGPSSSPRGQEQSRRETLSGSKSGRDHEGYAGNEGLESPAETRLGIYI